MTLCGLCIGMYQLRLDTGPLPPPPDPPAQEQDIWLVEQTSSSTIRVVSSRGNGPAPTTIGQPGIAIQIGDQQQPSAQMTPSGWVVEQISAVAINLISSLENGTAPSVSDQPGLAVQIGA